MKLETEVSRKTVLFIFGGMWS